MASRRLVNRSLLLSRSSWTFAYLIFTSASPAVLSSILGLLLGLWHSTASPSMTRVDKSKISLIRLILSYTRILGEERDGGKRTKKWLSSRSRKGPTECKGIHRSNFVMTAHVSPGFDGCSIS